MYSYTGNGAYCYANSLHMMLRAADAANLPEPGFLECLTTMPFGKLLLKGDMPQFFPSGPGIEPDNGLTVAVKTLGWAADEYYGGTETEAYNRLRKAVETAPVLVGPLDMGWLTYNPEHPSLQGADHFVMVMAVDDEQVQVHDPAGYPFAMLPREDFMRAWAAEAVGYGRRPFMMRMNFRQVSTVTRVEMIAETLSIVRSNLQTPLAPFALAHGAEALNELVRLMHAEVSPDLAGWLTYFALPLGARRLNDAAAFVFEGGLPNVADLLERQARIFGEAVYFATGKRWDELSRRMEQAAKLEQAFETAIL